MSYAVQRGSYSNRRTSDTVTKMKPVKDISDEVKEKIVGGNAISFMGGSLPRALATERREKPNG